MMMMSGSHGRESKYPFTASQWQELEHQALIFKYMAAGHPIPSDLILPIRRSMFLDSAAAAATSPASLFPQHPNSLGWGYFQMGFGRKTEDPEPGRCRRTDGKKWRCSKEAHPDSKYCERHMHRGKNRSRKPVEMSLTAPNNPAAASVAAAAATSSSSCSSSITVASNNLGALYHHPLTSATSYDGHQMYPVAAPAGYAASTYRPPTAAACGIGLSPHAAGIHHHPSSASTQFHIESLGGGCFTDRDYNRYFNPGLTKDEVADQYSGGYSTAADGSWRFTQLGLGATETAKQQQQQRDHPYASPLLHHHNSFGGGAAAYSHHVAATDPQKDDKQQQHCFVLGADIRQMDKGTVDRDGGGGVDQGDDERKPQKPLRHFFDEWPLKNGGGGTGKDSWIGGLDDEDTTRSGGGATAAASNNNWSPSASSFSNTQLSISTPMAASHDLSLQW